MNGEDQPVVFPMPEGPSVKPPIAQPTEAPEEAPTAPAPLGPDGFGAQAFYTVNDPGTGPQTSPTSEQLVIADAGFFKVAGDAAPLQIPGDPGFQFFDFNFVAQQVQFVHFLSPVTKVINRIAVMISQVPATGTLDVGLYNAAGTSKLTSSGPSSFPASSPAPKAYTVGSFLLVAGTEYIFAVLPGAFTGATPGMVGVSYGSGTIGKWNQQSGSTLPGYKSGSITYIPALTGTLPNDLTATTPSVTAGASSGPFGVLAKV